MWKLYGVRKDVRIVCIVIGTLLLFGICVWGFFLLKKETPIIENPVVVGSTIRHPLTGQILSSSLDRLPWVFGVMIENAADAWPLSGVEDAFLVIEAPVEGNIPRFIAFFSQDQDVEKIGPVRSARPYYLDWNTELGGIYAHVGGSPGALEDIADQDILDLNQFYQSEYFYRDELTRYAPHNVYTTTDMLRDSIQEIESKYDISVPEYDSWLFADGPESTSRASSIIHIDWSNSSGYNVNWKYDPSVNSYTRIQGGNTYTANNIVILETDISVISGDDKGRKELVTIGQGTMRLFYNGEEIVGTWKKSSADARLRFYDADGEEIVMNAGKTWIEVVDSLDRLRVEQGD